MDETNEETLSKTLNRATPINMDKTNDETLSKKLNKTKQNEETLSKLHSPKKVENKHEETIIKRFSRAIWALSMTIFLILRHIYLSFIKLFVGTKVDKVKGKTWLITGAAGGLGKAFCQSLARRGVGRLILWDVNKSVLEDFASELKKKYEDCVVEIKEVDVGNAEEVKKATREANSRGPVHVVVNNAGVACISPVLKMSEEEIEKIYRVNTLAHFWTIRAFMNEWILEEHPEHHHIVTIGSVTGMVGINLCSAYSGSKAAVHAMHESIYQELRQSKLSKKIHMTLVCPWWINNTGMFNGAKLTLGAKPLEPDYLSKRIIDAVDCSEEVVVMPKSLSYVVPWKMVMSVELGWQLFSKVSRSPQVMEDLYQRTVMNNNNNEKVMNKIVLERELINLKKVDPPAA